jgi:hypothetical protein
LLFTVHFKERLSNKRGPCIDELSIKNKFKSVTQKVGSGSVSREKPDPDKKDADPKCCLKVSHPFSTVFSALGTSKKSIESPFSFYFSFPTSKTRDALDRFMRKIFNLRPRLI